MAAVDDGGDALPGRRLELGRHRFGVLHEVGGVRRPDEPLSGRVLRPQQGVPERQVERHVLVEEHRAVRQPVGGHVLENGPDDRAVGEGRSGGGCRPGRRVGRLRRAPARRGEADAAHAEDPHCLAAAPSGRANGSQSSHVVFALARGQPSAAARVHLEVGLALQRLDGDEGGAVGRGQALLGAAVVALPPRGRDEIL